MQEFVKIIVGVCVLLLGFVAGKILARITKEELKAGQRWFKLIILVSLLGGLLGLILNNDILMFSMFFIAIVTSQSLR